MLDSDFFNLGYINLNMSSVIGTNTCKYTPEATVINVNRMIVTVNLNPKSQYNSACPNII